MTDIIGILILLLEVVATSYVHSVLSSVIKISRSSKHFDISLFKIILMWDNLILILIPPYSKIRDCLIYVKCVNKRNKFRTIFFVSANDEIAVDPFTDNDGDDKHQSPKKASYSPRAAQMTSSMMEEDRRNDVYFTSKC